MAMALIEMLLLSRRYLLKSFIRNPTNLEGLFHFIQVMRNLSLQIQTISPQVEHFLVMRAFQFKQLPKE